MRYAVLFLMSLIVFFLGWFSAGLVLNAPNIQDIGVEKPFITNIKGIMTGDFELASPSDRVEEDKIHVYSDRVILELDDPIWSTYADSNSMDPVLDKGANGIEIKPKQESDIEAGDIISFYSEKADGIVVHRVVKTGYDENGWYARTKGDNNSAMDSEKVRFDDINGVLIGVIY